MPASKEVPSIVLRDSTCCWWSRFELWDLLSPSTLLRCDVCFPGRLQASIPDSSEALCGWFSCRKAPWRDCKCCADLRNQFEWQWKTLQSPVSKLSIENYLLHSDNQLRQIRLTRVWWWVHEEVQCKACWVLSKVWLQHVWRGPFLAKPDGAVDFPQ